MMAANVNQEQENKKLDQELFQDLDRKLGNVALSPLRTGALPLGEWSDEWLLDNYEKIRIPASVRNRSIQKSAFIAFFKFYASGVLPSDTKPHQLIYTILCNLKNSNTLDERNYIFPDDKLSPTGFFDLPKFDHNDDDHRCRTISDDHLLSYHRFGGPYLSIFSSESAIDSDNFYRNIKKCYCDNCTDEREFQRGCRLAEYLCLMLMRSIADNDFGHFNNKITIFSHINGMKADLVNFANWPKNMGYAEPLINTLKMCQDDLKKPNTPNPMFILILGAYTKIIKITNVTQHIIYQFQSGLLNATMRYKMDLLTLMYSAIEALNSTISEVMKQSMNANSENSWKILVAFMEKYLDKTQPEHSFPWARVVREDFFINLPADRHPYLAGVFGGILRDMNMLDRQLTKCMWYKKDPSVAKKGVKLGMSMVIKLTGRKTNTYYFSDNSSSDNSE